MTLNQSEKKRETTVGGQMLGEQCFLSLEDLKKIKGSDRTIAQQKRYRAFILEKSRAKKTEDQKEATKMKNKEAMVKSRTELTEEEKKCTNKKNKEAKKKSRTELSEDDKTSINKKNKEAMKKSRTELSEDDKKSINKKKKEDMKKSRKNPKSSYVARNANDVLQGKQIVKELKLSNDSIGKMDKVCDDCFAK